MTKSFTKGDMRPVIAQNELTTSVDNGSVVLNSQRTRPLWFDGRFLAARDLSREQDYFLERQANLGQSAGFGVIHGLTVEQPAASNRMASDVLIVRAGHGVTPAGELVLLPDDLTLHLADLPDDLNLDVQFGTSAKPAAPERNRTGLFVLALRPVEFTANPMTSYPTSIQGTRTTHDGNIVEATAVSLIPYPDPVSSYDAAQRRAALAKQIFVTSSPTQLSPTILPLAMISIQFGVVDWVDMYLVRRDTGPQYSGLRFGLTDPATQQAFLMQYDAQLQATVAARTSSGQSANFAASSYFQALPPAGRFPMAAISVSSQGAAQAFTQTFFPQQLDVRLSIVPVDEIPALIEDSMSLPPLDLTLPQNAYADLAVFALIPVPRAGFGALKDSLPVIAPAATVQRVLSFAPPLDLLRMYRGIARPQPVPASSNASWASVIAGQTYGFYIRRRSAPAFVDFAVAAPVPT